MMSALILMRKFGGYLILKLKKYLKYLMKFDCVFLKNGSYILFIYLNELLYIKFM